MSTTPTTPATSISTVRNGVALDRLFGTIDAVRDQPEFAQFRFTAVSTWIEGTATRSTFRDWYGIGATRQHARTWSAQSDHPTLGHGHGPTPHEYDIDVRGVLGVTPDVRNGFSQIRATFNVEGNADDDVLDALVEASRQRSATYEMLVNPTPVHVETTRRLQ
jgi:hypothetical protein